MDMMDMMDYGGVWNSEFNGWVFGNVEAKSVEKERQMMEVL